MIRYERAVELLRQNQGVYLLVDNEVPCNSIKDARIKGVGCDYIKVELSGRGGFYKVKTSDLFETYEAAKFALLRCVWTEYVDTDGLSEEEVLSKEMNPSLLLSAMQTDTKVYAILPDKSKVALAEVNEILEHGATFKETRCEDPVWGLAFEDLRSAVAAMRFFIEEKLKQNRI